MQREAYLTANGLIQDKHNIQLFFKAAVILFGPVFMDSTACGEAVILFGPVLLGRTGNGEGF